MDYREEVCILVTVSNQLLVAVFVQLHSNHALKLLRLVHRSDYVPFLVWQKDCHSFSSRMYRLSNPTFYTGLIQVHHGNSF